MRADPTFAPSHWNCTLATPTLSDAVQRTVTVPETVAPLAGDVIEAVGAVVSAVLVVVLDPLVTMVMVAPAGEPTW